MSVWTPTSSTAQAGWAPSFSCQRFLREQASRLDGTLPPPGEEWLTADVGLSGRMVRRLSQEAVIEPAQEEKVKVRRDDSTDTYHATLWETTEGAWRFLQDYLDRRNSLCPSCGATGFSNPPSEDGLVCIDCDRPLDEARVRAHFGGDTAAAESESESESESEGRPSSDAADANEARTSRGYPP